MPIRSRLIPPTILLALGLLSGCSAALKVSLCPTAVILADTAQMTQFRAGAVQDLSGAAYTVQLVDVSTDCVFDKRNNSTSSSLSLKFRATRAPTAEAAEYSIPYFVAVSQSDRMLSKKIFSVRFTFAPGAAIATFSDSVDETDIKLEQGHPGYDYELITGLQLTQAQMDYNKKIGPYIP